MSGLNKWASNLYLMPGELLLEYDKIEKGLGFGKAKPVPYPLPNISDVVELAERYVKPEARFLCCFLYLTGQRVSEFLETRRNDITMQSDQNHDVLVVNTLTEKNREYPRRTLPIVRAGVEKPMVDYVIDYLHGMDGKERICDLSRTNCWNVLASQGIEVDCINQDKSRGKILLQVYPHFLRHCRASHLAMYHGFDIYKLMEFFGWRSPLTPSIYAKMNWKSLAAPMIKSSQENKKI